MSTVFIMPQSAQEAIFATAAIEAYLRGGSGESPVLVCAPGVASLFVQDNRFRAVVTVEFKHLFRRWRSIGRQLAEVKAQYGPFETVINLDNTPQSAWLAARIPCKNRAGYKTPFAPPLIWRHLPKPDPHKHRSAHYASLIGLLLNKPDLASTLPKLQGGQQTGSGTLRIGLAPSQGEGALQTWGAHRWGETALRLTDDGLPVLMGLPDAQGSVERMDEVLRYNGSAQLERVPESTSWQQYRAAIGSLDLIIATEGELLQIALALGVPAVAIFGAGDPQLTGPLKGQRAKLLCKKTECAPCITRKCAHLHRLCLEGITPQEAVAAARSLLKG